MLEQHSDNGRAVIRSRIGLFAICTALLALSAGALARDVDVTVISPSSEGTPITVGFRWVLQEDVTYETLPGMAVEDELSTNLHKSHLPVVATGDSGGAATTTVTIPDDSKRYYISVLPDQPDGIDCQGTNDCFTMSGRQILPGQSDVYVTVSPQPLPTAQIYIMAHADVAPINNAWDAIEFEPGLGGFDVFIFDFTGGILSTDNYGNPIGTEYALAADGLTPEVTRLGDGTIHTMTQEEVGDPLRNPYGLRVGEALVKNLAPGKYGVRVVPPQGENWQQTSTIEGTKTIDAWVKAGEPRFYSEFARRGPVGHHATFGFVRPEAFAPLTGTGTITGQNMSLGFRRVPDTGFDLRPPTGVSPCYIGLNDQTNISQGIYAGTCNDDDSFTIENVPAGTYLVMIFDRYLGNIFNAQSVTVGDGETVDMGEIGTFRWFGTLEESSFYDENEDGQWQRDVEPSLDEQATILRFRDGSVYQASATDFDGFVPFDEIFPFFQWLVAEVDFGRFKHTGTTVVVDNGGPVSNDDFGEGRRNPQIQNPDDGGTNCTATNGSGQTGCVSRTETGPALLEGFLKFLGFNSRIEWGKKEWEEGENGGVSGIVYYATTRAEDDVRFAAAEPWEPGVPRVQVNLYPSDSEGNIDPAAGGDITVVEFADIDNHPLGWSEGGAMGPEDENNNSIGGDAAGCEATLSCVFNVGDAVEWAHTDSFDDNPPTDCPADSNTYGVAAPDPLHLPPDGEAATQFNGRCYDSQRNLNQIRPAVFDGGFGLGAPWTGMDDVDNEPTGNFPGPEDVDHNGDGIFDDVDYLPSGYYVLEAATPPGYIATATKDKNVDFGDTFTVNPLFLPPICVGDPDTIAAGDELNLFPGVDAPFQDSTRRMCDRKLIQVTDGRNAAADFFLHTETPVAGQWKGFAINDLANEFDFLSPSFGEKWAPPHIPVSVRDYLGNEVYHSRTDRYGQYNVVVPSSFRINTPMASGVSANMLQLCLNTPFMENPDFNPLAGASPDNPKLIPDPYFNKEFSQFCWTFNAHAGLTTYLDTPLFAISAFSGPNNWQLDCEYPTLTPVIHSVSVENNTYGGGPYVAPGATGAGRVITITSAGMTEVADPNGTRLEGVDTAFITRDFGFGDAPGTVTINGVPLDVEPGDWFDEGIIATIPDGVTTGQLVVTRGDNSVSTVVGLTVIIDDGTIPMVTPVVPGSSPDAIQDAIDATPANGVVLVPPGEYSEGLFVTKPIQLQGWGANVTTILSAHSPTERLQQWREKANYLVNCTEEIGLLPSEYELFEGPDPLPPGAEAWGEAQFNNVPNVLAPCGHTPGTGLFSLEEAPGILVAPRAGVFDGTSSSRIDGFTITGAINSHGIYVNGYANFQEISNNRVNGNQGKSGAGGIRVGLVRERATHPARNHSEFVNIHHNDISQNSSLIGPGGGLLVTRGTDNYRITNNFVCGNFTAGDGAGIAHFGLSENGLIADNKVLLNHSFSQFPGLGTNGGGILVSGQGERVMFEPELPEIPTPGDPPLTAAFVATAGSGNVKILRNLVQGNNAGSGDGGGIALANLNGQDVLASSNQDTWHHVDVLNNTIINNVAGMTGGGISIKDGLKVSIVNNTVMNNDSTATAFNAFGTCPAGSAPTVSCPQPAGISAYAHSIQLLDTGGAVGTFSNPTMINNIVLGNRSQHWEVSFDPGLGFDVGALVNDPLPSDFGVFPATAGTLTASSSIFTTGSIAAGHVIDAGGTNIEVDGTIPGSTTCPVSPTAGDGECAIVLNPYRNGPPGFSTVQPDGTVYAFSEFPADAKIAFDEGGNAIDVHYGPLSQVGDYHLQTANTAVNVALGAGATPSAAMYPARSPDIDREGRPRCDTLPCSYDIGADEVGGQLGSGDGNQAPMVLDPVSGGTVTAYDSTPSGYQVIAHDPNGDSPLGYALCAGASSGPCGALPAGMSINGNGLISFAGPVPGDAGTYHLVVTDPFGATAESDFTLDVISPFAPDAVDDYFDVTAAGQWVLPYDNISEGFSFLQLNDTHPDEAIYGPVVRLLESGLTPATAGFIAIDKQSLNPLSPEFPIMSSLEYTPLPDFIGFASFSYRLTNNAGTDTATVTLGRFLTMTDARYEPTTGMYHFAGRGFTPGEMLTIGLGPEDDIDFGPTGWATGDPIGPEDIDWNGNGIFDLGFKIPLPGGTTIVAGDGTWSVDVAGPPPGPIDRIGVTGTVVTPPSTIVHQINDAPFLSVTASGNSPLSTAYVQCPGDIDGDAIIDIVDPTRQVVCKHLGAGDGFVRMADGRELYGFSFNDLTGVPQNLAIDKGILNAQFPAPTLEFNENDEVYLTLTNVAMLIRPDLFDPHTVHFHGFPNASSTFDGVPESSISINGGFSLTYYYNVVEPGTYMYHCHVEAAEHMQMGMLGNLYVNPKQNGEIHNGYDKFVYNDEDGSTGYDVVVPIQIGSFDGTFHDASFLVQPLPFAEMRDDYQLLNGRGYPDTTLAGPLPVVAGGEKESAGVTSSNESSQVVNTVVTATAGEKILLRISNLNVTQFYTLATTGLTMQVVGQGAHILRGPGGTDLYYQTNSVTLGGGQAVDVLIDTTGLAEGTYLLYSTNLNELSNGTEDFGGMMTEIVIN